MTRAVEVALVGCGAIAQRGYLPALAQVPEVRCAWLVDVRREVAGPLARRFGIPGVTDDYLRVLDHVEAVLVAVPNHLHAPMTLEALARGKAVLCEKPLGRTLEEVRQMVAAAQKARVPLVAGLILRYQPWLQALQRAFPWEALGAVREIRASYGNPLDWPVSHLSFFDREQAGGGAFLDLGVHLVDCLFWILSLGGASVLEYQDDGGSGVEAEARASLTVVGAPGARSVPCRLEVSWLRRLGNQIEISGERASLRIFLSGPRAPELRGPNGTPPRAVVPLPPSGINVFAEQLRGFARRVRGVEANCAEGDSQLKVLELVEACYRMRTSLAFPWDPHEPWTSS